MAFNAWDHQPPPSTHLAYAETQYALQRSSPVSSFDAHRFNSNPSRWWDLFYTHNTTNFFKDRKWLHQEFPILAEMTHRDAGKKIILEIGAGAGNTAFPILAANENEELSVFACDFSKRAVELIQRHEAYDGQRIRASVWDVADEEMSRPEGVDEGTVDIVLMIFIFSALSPAQWARAVQNIWGCLKVGGTVLFRDYGRGDLAQVRFKKGRYLEENFYVRGDGTRVYFFEIDELKEIWGGTAQEEGIGFEVVDLEVDRRMLVNRKRELKMYRCWLQGRFRKVDDGESNLSAEKVLDFDGRNL